jgi:hypothetical protein
MQHAMGLTKKHKANRKRTRLYRRIEWKTFRFLILNRAGRIVHNQGKKVLEMTRNAATEKLYNNILSSLAALKLKKAA